MRGDVVGDVRLRRRSRQDNMRRQASRVTGDMTGQLLPVAILLQFRGVRSRLGRGDLMEKAYR